MKLVVNAPVNKVSFGNVSYNILKELYKRQEEIETVFVPLGKFDSSSFDKIEEDFKKWIVESSKDNQSRINKEDKALKLWHISGSQNLVCRKQLLYTFYELDTPTQLEKDIVNYQDGTIFSSSYAEKSFSSCYNVSSAGLGFDQDFVFLNKQYFDKNVVHFTLMGKAEKRKNTKNIIQAWIKKFGNNPKFKLTCMISNPHLDLNWHKQFVYEALNGEQVNNIGFNGWANTNSEINDFLCSSDIDLTALSGGEGWNLPAFNSACLGARIVGNNLTSHADWVGDIADGRFYEVPEACFQKISAEDGIFFSKTSKINQGNIYNLVDLDEAGNQMEKAAQDVLKEKEKDYLAIRKEAGVKLQEKHKYSTLVDKIVEVAKDI